MSSEDTFGSGLLGCTLYKVVITQELMSLASGLRDAQMHELTLSGRLLSSFWVLGVLAKEENPQCPSRAQ